MTRSEPALNVPAAVTGVAALLTVVQAVKSFLPDETKITLILALAFIPARYSGAAPELPGGYLTAVTSFVTYMMVHAGWVHLIVNLLWMLAFGSALARRMSGLAFVFFSVLCGIAGAFTHLLFHFGDMTPVIGASAATSGQMAGALRFFFNAKPHPGERTPDFAAAPTMSLGQALSDGACWPSRALDRRLFRQSAVKIGGEEGTSPGRPISVDFSAGSSFWRFDRGRRTGESSAAS
jgi:membrane associated rhomboid family serine protease